MPIFDYKCNKCNHEFDKLLSISSRELPLSEPCPSCNEITVVRVINGVGLVQWNKTMQPDNTFKDLLKQIGKNNKGSDINTHFGS